VAMELYTSRDWGRCCRCCHGRSMPRLARIEAGRSDQLGEFVVDAMALEGPAACQETSFGLSERRGGSQRLHDYNHGGAIVADNKSGPAEGVKGVAEGMKGKAKEAVGAVTGNEELSQEGQAQQDKADAEREAASKEAAAEKARGKAEAQEQRQRSHQD
jgi:uncharacterized protein YjbJ (UPF0337 family)